MSQARNRLLLGTVSAAFAALAGLVASGATRGLDQWACDHLMPFAGKPAGTPSFLESLVPLLHAGWHPAGMAIAQVVTLPGQVVVSFLLVALAARKLREPVWIAAWLAGTVVEVVAKHFLTRPALYRDGLHAVAFDNSWPSGHTLRCALVAIALAAAWPRLCAVLAAWLVAAIALLVLAGFHTPTDVAGGLLLALLAGGAALRARRALRET